MDANVKVVCPPENSEIVITATLQAPLDTVFAVMTDPSSINEWWGPSRYTTEVEEMNAITGGRWRFVQRDAEGGVHPFNGVYHRVESPTIVQTFEYEPMKGHIALETMTLSAASDETTHVEVHSSFQSFADRDGMAQSGMESGVSETYNRLNIYLQKVKP